MQIKLELEFPGIPTAVFTRSQVFAEIPRFFIFAHLQGLGINWNWNSFREEFQGIIKIKIQK